MNAMSLRKMVVVFALVGVLAGFVQADKLELQAKLSKEVPIQLKDVTIVEALDEIGKKAGLEIVLSDEAAWKLPQGGATRLRVGLKGPVAESLTEMLNAFFMRYAVGEEQITVYPRPELEHILGRPTTRQLELLRDIYTKPIEVYWNGEPQKSINEALGQEVLVLPIDLHEELNNKLRVLREREKVVRTVAEKTEERDGKVVTEKVTKELYKLSAPLTVAQLLSRRSWAWYLSGVDFLNQIPEIHIVGEGDFRKAKLDQIVDISMEGEAAVIIQRLANWTGMGLYWEKRDPDWPEDGIIGVGMQNTKLGQALRNVVSMVNGEIRIDTGDNIIRIAGPMHEKKRPAPRATRISRRPSESGKITRAGGDYVGKISIPMDGGKYYIEFMLRESDLTDELRKLRDEKMEQVLGRPPKPRPAATPPRPARATPEPAAKPARTPTRRSR